MLLTIDRWHTVWINFLLLVDDLFDFIFENVIESKLGIAFISCIVFSAICLVFCKLLKVVFGNA